MDITRTTTLVTRTITEEVPTYTLTVTKARDNPIRIIEASIPIPKGKGIDYDEEAFAIFCWMTCTLPGGTYDSLCQLMLGDLNLDRNQDDKKKAIQRRLGARHLA